VAALHVVGKDFQLRLAIDFRVRRQQQRLVHLVAVGFLGISSDLDLTLKHTARAAGEDVLTVWREVQPVRDMPDDSGENHRAVTPPGSVPHSDGRSRRDH